MRICLLCFYSSSIFNVAERILYDIRDNEAYTVRKLADGNCWMTSNLRLVFAGDYVGKYDSTTNTISATTVQITPENSDVAETWLPGETTETSDTNTAWVADVSSQTESEINTPKSHRTSETLTDRDGLTQQIGTYYNWNAATAGQGVYSMQHYEYSDNSICPKGFKLPGLRGYGGNGWPELLVAMYQYDHGNIGAIIGEEAIAYTAEVIAAMQKFPLSIIKGGFIYVGDGLPSSVGVRAHYQTAVSWGESGDFESSYDFYAGILGTDASSPIYNVYNKVNKTAGLAVRCIAR